MYRRHDSAAYLFEIRVGEDMQTRAKRITGVDRSSLVLDKTLIANWIGTLLAGLRVVRRWFQSAIQASQILRTCRL